MADNEIKPDRDDEQVETGQIDRTSWYALGPDDEVEVIGAGEDAEIPVTVISADPPRRLYQPTERTFTPGPPLGSVPPLPCKEEAPQDPRLDGTDRVPHEPGETLWKAPRKSCGAKTRSGTPCRRKPRKNGRCRLHGGLSRAGFAHPNYKHGRYSKDPLASFEAKREALLAKRRAESEKFFNDRLERFEQLALREEKRLGRELTEEEVWELFGKDVQASCERALRRCK
jgi:hypothetical protein